MGYSQTMYPTKQKVADIYDEVSSKINSAPALKKFRDNDKITPLLALEIIAAGVKINSQEDMAYWLERFDIPISTDASVVDIYDAVYYKLKTERFANNILTETMDNKLYDAAVFLDQISKEDPSIIENCEEYLEIIKDLDAFAESQEIGGQYTETDLEIVKNVFAESCQRINVNPVTVINAYANYTRLPELAESLNSEENLLTNFTRQLSVLKGRYLALYELMSTKGDEKAVSKILKRYEKDYKATQKNHAKQVQALEKYWNKIQNNENPFAMKIFKQRTDFVEDLNLKFLENEGRKITTDALYKGKIVPMFTESGAIALTVLALFDAVQHLMKVQDIKAYSAARNLDALALQDALEENKYNLYAFLEQLPDKAKDAAFEYIAEDYFDNFQNQTGDLLLALEALEKSSLNNVPETKQEMEQKVSDKFDKIYPNTEKSFKQNIFN